MNYTIQDLQETRAQAEAAKEDPRLFRKQSSILLRRIPLIVDDCIDLFSETTALKAQVEEILKAKNQAEEAANVFNTASEKAAVYFKQFVDDSLPLPEMIEEVARRVVHRVQSLEGENEALNERLRESLRVIEEQQDEIADLADAQDRLNRTQHRLNELEGVIGELKSQEGDADFRADTFETRIEEQQDRLRDMRDGYEGRITELQDMLRTAQLSERQSLEEIEVWKDRYLQVEAQAQELTAQLSRIRSSLKEAVTRYDAVAG